MKKLFLFIITIASITAAGQNHLIGVKGGVNITNVNFNDDPIPIETKNTISYIRGLTYEYFLSKHFSLGAELLYEHRGWNKDVPYYDEFGPGKTLTNREDFTYLSLPLKAGYSIGGKLYGFMNLGVIPARLLSCKVTLPIENGGAVYDAYSNYKNYDIAALVELGGGYKIKDRIRLFSSFAYQHSLITASMAQNEHSLELTHYGMSLTIGFKYSIVK